MAGATIAVSSPPDSKRESAASGTRFSGITVRSIFVSLVLLFLSLLWLQQAGLITLTVQIDESVPPIPSVAAMMLMLLVIPLIRRLNERFGGPETRQSFQKTMSLFAQTLTAAGLVLTLLVLNHVIIANLFTVAGAAFPLAVGILLLGGIMSHAELIVVYTVLAVGVSMSSVGAIRIFLPCITAPFYFATPENNFASLNIHLPDWFGPRDHEILRAMYEGSPGESAPWSVWLPYLTGWTVFFLVFFFTLLCLCTIVRRHWIETERLSFPLIQMVLQISDPDSGDDHSPPFYRNPLMWLGFGISFVYNATNMINAYNPSFIAIGKEFDIGALFTEKPLNAMNPLTIQYRPEIFGIGYLMGTDVLFTVWFFYLIFKAEQLIASAAGYQIAGFPFEQEQSCGAYIALGIALLYFARKPIAHIIRSAFGGAKGLESTNGSVGRVPASERLAVWGAILGLASIIAFCMAAGMSLFAAVLYIGLVMGFAMIYTRVRAETGAPYIWLFPWYIAKKSPIYWFGSSFWGDKNLTMLSSFMFLSRGFFPQFASYQMEGFKIADEVRMSRKQMAGLLIFACFVGVVGALWIHLSTYYRFGANVLEGGTTAGGYRTQLVTSEWTDLVKFVKTPAKPDLTRITATGVGFLTTATLVLLRIIFLRFPLHPLGYAMVCCYAEVLFGPFLFVWLFKMMILKFGGMRLYKKLVPTFLGIVMGHYITAGLIWGLLSMSGHEVFLRYGVWFG